MEPRVAGEVSLLEVDRADREDDWVREPSLEIREQEELPRGIILSIPGVRNTIVTVTKTLASGRSQGGGIKIINILFQHKCNNLL